MNSRKRRLTFPLIFQVWLFDHFFSTGPYGLHTSATPMFSQIRLLNIFQSISCRPISMQSIKRRADLMNPLMVDSNWVRNNCEWFELTISQICNSIDSHTQKKEKDAIHTIKWISNKFHLHTQPTMCVCVVDISTLDCHFFSLQRQDSGDTRFWMRTRMRRPLNCDLFTFKYVDKCIHLCVCVCTKSWFHCNN